MRRLLPVLALIAAVALPGGAAAAGPDARVLADPVTARVIGGEPAVEADWGFAVALTTDFGSQFCGGSLVQPQWVLTAGHCKIYPAGTVRVVARQPDLRQAVGGSEVVRMYRHPDYRMAVPGAPRNDLMLLRLRDPVDAPTIALAADRPATGRLLRVAGWGATSYNRANDTFGPSSPILRSAAVRVRASDTCVADYGTGVFVPSVMVCASLPGQDACAGDSGGPLVEGSGDQARLVAVVSWGTGCALPGYPGVYALTTPHRCWVTSMTTPPRPVGQVVAVPEDGAIELEWAWAKPCGNAPEPGVYRVRVAETGQVLDVPGAQRRTTLAGLANGQPYTISVSAVNDNGESAPVAATGTPAPAPVIVSGAEWTGPGSAALVVDVPPQEGALRWRSIATGGNRTISGAWTEIAPDPAARRVRVAVDGLPAEALRLRLEVDRLGVVTPTRSAVLAKPLAPALIGRVRVTGTPETGRRLTCEIGRWTGTRPLTVARQWLRDGRPIPGADARTYAAEAADAGRGLRCRVTVAGPGGTTRASSDPVVVAA